MFEMMTLEASSATGSGTTSSSSTAVAVPMPLLLVVLVGLHPTNDRRMFHTVGDYGRI